MACPEDAYNFLSCIRKVNTASLGDASIEARASPRRLVKFVWQMDAMPMQEPSLERSGRDAGSTAVGTVVNP